MAALCRDLCWDFSLMRLVHNRVATLRNSRAGQLRMEKPGSAFCGNQQPQATRDAETTANRVSIVSVEDGTRIAKHGSRV